MKKEISTEERVWAVLAHLSALALGMGLLLPVIGWSEQRRKSNYASFQCLQALGYQSLGYTIWLLVTLVVIMITALGAVAGVANAVNAENLEDEMLAIVIGHTTLMFGLIGIYFVLPVVAAVACALGRDFRYPLMGNRLARYLDYEPLQVSEEKVSLIEEHEDRWVVAMGHFSVIIMLWGMLAPLTVWVLQGKRSQFLRFQTIQTLVFQVGVTLLVFFGFVAYLTGAFSLIATFAIYADGIDSSGGMFGFAVFILCALIAIVALLAVPFFHIVGQWAGYKILKGENYRYQLVGRLVEKRLSKSANSIIEEKPV